MRQDNFIRVSLNLKGKILRSIWEEGTIKIDPETSFKLTSGDFSPIYIDCRLLFSSPEFRKLFINAAVEKLDELDLDIVAGGATGGIPYATLVAEELDLPLIYVRKEVKDCGKKGQIEGMKNLHGKKVLLVDDLITTGQSKINFIEGIRKAGGRVENCLVLFDRKQGGSEILKAEGIDLMSMVSLEEALDYGLERSFISQKKYEKVIDYIES